MKQVGLKIENKGVYQYFMSAYRVEETLHELVKKLQNGDAIEIKCGKEHHYIDYDEDEVSVDFPYDYQIRRVMYYVKERLGSHS